MEAAQAPQVEGAAPGGVGAGPEVPPLPSVIQAFRTDITVICCSLGALPDPVFRQLCMKE